MLAPKENCLRCALVQCTPGDPHQLVARRVEAADAKLTPQLVVTGSAAAPQQNR